MGLHRPSYDLLTLSTQIYFHQMLLFPFKTWVQTEMVFCTNMLQSLQTTNLFPKIIWVWAEAEKKGEHKASIHLISFKLASLLLENAIYILKQRNHLNGYITITAPPIHLHLHPSIWQNTGNLNRKKVLKHSWSILRLFSPSNLHLWTYSHPILEAIFIMLIKSIRSHFYVGGADAYL